jgi:hypothetical protein
MISMLASVVANGVMHKRSETKGGSKRVVDSDGEYEGRGTKRDREEEGFL